MIRALRLMPLLCVALTMNPVPSALADGLPVFAGGGGDLPALKQPADPTVPPPSPWAGLTMGTEMFGSTGLGHGSRGGFGGDTFIGYNKEFDNNLVLGVQGSIGRLPGLSKYGPNGYDFGMADVKLGYDMGRFMPYVSFGLGQAGATGGIPRPAEQPQFGQQPVHPLAGFGHAHQGNRGLRLRRYRQSAYRGVDFGSAGPWPRLRTALGPAARRAALKYAYSPSFIGDAARL